MVVEASDCLATAHSQASGIRIFMGAGPPYRYWPLVSTRDGTAAVVVVVVVVVGGGGTSP